MLKGRDEQNQSFETRFGERKKAKEGWPAVVYFWIIGLALASYLVARIALDAFPHPYHWFPVSLAACSALAWAGYGIAGAAMFFNQW